MDRRWELELYTAADGTCELEDWILNLKTSHRDKVIAWIDKLQEMGPLLPRPYADVLRDGIHELRIKLSSDQVRILYFFVCENRVILTHPLYKRVSRVPNKEIKKAVMIREEYLKRNGK